MTITCRVTLERFLHWTRFVLVDRKTFSMHFRWILFCGVVCLAAIAWYCSESLRERTLLGGSSLPGLVFGSAAALIMVFELLLWPRKKLRAWRIGRAQVWMRAHIWLGLLSVPLVVLHTGFQWGGHLSTILAIVFAVVVVSGIYGLIMQNILPRIMLDQLPAETIYSQIDEVAEQFAQDARRKVNLLCPRPRSIRQSEAGGASADSDDDRFGPVVIGAVRNQGSFRGRVLQTETAPVSIRHAETLRDAFDTTIYPFLLDGNQSSAVAILGTRAKASAWFISLRNTVDEAAHETVDELESLCEQRRQFNVQARMHWWLHNWIALHLPLSFALIVLLFVHVFVALKYW